MVHRVTREAEADLDDIWLYIARETASMDVATNLVDSISGRFPFLASFPYAGRARDQEFGIGSRSFPVGEYVIVYAVMGDEIAILRVVHSRRDLEGIFGH